MVVLRNISVCSSDRTQPGESLEKFVRGHLSGSGIISLSAFGRVREWVKEEIYIPTIPNWGVGSDRRPIVATFEASDK